MSDPRAPQSGDFTTPDNAILVPTEEVDIEYAPAKPQEIAVHDPGSSRSWWIPGGMLIVAAAAIAAWWIWPPSAEIRELEGPAPVAEASQLPSYVLETDGGLGPEDGARGEAAQARHRYRRETPFEWVLRPKSAVEGEVQVRAFAFVDGSSAGLPLAIDALVSVAETGSIQIEGEIGQLGLEPGRYSIALVVARADSLPQDASELGEGAGEHRRLEISIE